MSIEDIIAQHVGGADLRAGFERTRENLKRQIADATATYRLEQANPTYVDDAARSAQLANIERQISFLAWAIEDIDKRLAGADEALNGRAPNRAERRLAERNGAKVEA